MESTRQELIGQKRIKKEKNLNEIIRRVAILVALFYIVAMVIAQKSKSDELVIELKPIVVKPMEGFELKPNLPLVWSLEIVPHHITVEIEGTPFQLAFQHNGYEVDEYCVRNAHACPTIRATDKGDFLFTHYDAGIPFTYRTRQLPNMWRLIPEQWQWIYRTTTHEAKD